MLKPILNREENPKKRLWANIFYVALGLLTLWLMLSAWGLFDNYLSFDGKYSPLHMKIGGTLLFFALCVYVYLVMVDTIKPTRWTPAYILAGFIFCLSFTLNFTYSGKDIQQHRTFFNANGTFRMELFETWIEENKELYQENNIDITDTSFTNYVLQYQELPGRNNYSSLIRAKEIPKSTAPRANENFPLPNDLK